MTSYSAKARARSNIALAKYWGKSDIALNVPAVPSISMTLDRLHTETRVTFDPKLKCDRLFLDRKLAKPGETKRVTAMLDKIRLAADLQLFAKIESENNFPTAAGLASSASGFAALAGAASQAAGLNWDHKRLSRIARQSSASAARSLFGGFVELPAGKPGQDVAAKPLAPADYWDLRLVVAVTAAGRKKVGSTEGMERSRKTSPFYEEWLDTAGRLNRVVRNSIRKQDLDRLGAAMEQSTLCFHTCAITSVPSIWYWKPATLAAMETIRDLRDRRSISVWATIDAGPHVKALCHAEDAGKVRRALAKTEGVHKTILTQPGAGIEIGIEIDE
jgi:diphosphomevalonate decarboxylase